MDAQGHHSTTRDFPETTVAERSEGALRSGLFSVTQSFALVVNLKFCLRLKVALGACIKKGGYHKTVTCATGRREDRRPFQVL